MNLQEVEKVIDIKIIKELLTDSFYIEINNFELLSLITSLIVKDLFGGQIMIYKAHYGFHYYNLINESIIDLTKDQSSKDNSLYQEAIDLTEEELLDNEELKNTYLSILKEIKKRIAFYKEKTYKLIDRNNKEYQSTTPGTLGGHKKLKIYGRLDCPSAKKWIEKGHYVPYRVFFENEDIAISAGYRPCAVCMPKEYQVWKQKKLTK